MEIGRKMGWRLISRLGAVSAVVAAVAGYMWVSNPSLAENAADKPEQDITAESQGVAIFAGGCFWCLEADMDYLPGVLSTTSGYTAGTIANPTYKTHYKKKPGQEAHYEAVRVVYDTSVLTYEELLTAFWHSVDVTDDGGQFCDRGDSYRTAVFVTEEQRDAAEASKAQLEKGEWPKEPIVTPILDVAKFYPAETYHQDYYKKNPIRYRYYRAGCGRDRTVKRVWGPLAFTGLPKS